ncbi:hypothetical protein [Rhodococcus sp. 311R]|uniref:hypothetical protein n=1 Tax=Rhodococcus sp. 311R TaxID=1617904 RepID=UPI00067E8321|nr:hypothetical protein [Rhodococcus sp. 311R]
MAQIWWKCPANLQQTQIIHGLSMASLGLYLVIMSNSKRNLTVSMQTSCGHHEDIMRTSQGGLVALKEIEAAAKSANFKGWRAALQELMRAGLLTSVDDDFVQADWSLQDETKATKAPVTSEYTKVGIQVLCAAGNHERCYLPFCDKVERYARGHGLTHTCKRCKEVSSRTKNQVRNQKNHSLDKTQTQTETNPLKGLGEGGVKYENPEPENPAGPEPRNPEPRPSGGSAHEPALKRKSKFDSRIAVNGVIQ